MDVDKKGNFKPTTALILYKNNIQLINYEGTRFYIIDTALILYKNNIQPELYLRQLKEVI